MPLQVAGGITPPSWAIRPIPRANEQRPFLSGGVAVVSALYQRVVPGCREMDASLKDCDSQHLLLAEEPFPFATRPATTSFAIPIDTLAKINKPTTTTTAGKYTAETRRHGRRQRPLLLLLLLLLLLAKNEKRSEESIRNRCKKMRNGS